MNTQIFGISLMTIILVLVVFYIGRKTSLFSFLPVIG